MYYQSGLKIKLSNLFRLEFGQIQINYIFATAFENQTIFILKRWRDSSAGKSVGFITRRPRVRLPISLQEQKVKVINILTFFYFQLFQSCTTNPKVEGEIREL